MWGVDPIRRGGFHETDPNHANLCLVAHCFRGEIHPSREAGPPERPQREARPPQAQSRLPMTPKKKSRPSQTQLLIPLCLPNTSTDQVTNSLRSSISVSPLQLAAWALGRRQPTEEIPRAIAPYPGLAKRVCRAGRGTPGRTRTVARLVGCQRVFLDLVRYSNSEHKQVLDRTQSRIFLEFLFNHEKYYLVSNCVPREGPRNRSSNV